MTYMVCPKCRESHLRILENHLTFDQYVICDRYPYCSYVEDLDPWIPVDLITVGSQRVSDRLT